MDNQIKFLKFCLDNNVLLFGDFTKKSGQFTPYFFNLGEFNFDNANIATPESEVLVIISTVGSNFSLNFSNTGPKSCPLEGAK